MKVCKDCKRRYIGCHAECETYLAERAEYDRIAEKARKIKEEEAEFITYKADRAYERRRHVNKL